MVLVLAGIFAVPFFLQPERHRQEMSDFLRSLFKHPVSFGPMAVEYFPPALYINQIAMTKEDGSTMLQVGKAVIPLDWSSILHWKLAPREIEDRRKIGLVENAEHDAAIKIERIGGRPDDAGGSQKRDPTVDSKRTKQRQELADKAVHAR